MDRSQAQRDSRVYAAYCRVSTEEQGENGVGLAAQKEALKKWLSQQGHARVAFFEDVQTSRVPLHEREQGSRLVGAVEKGAISGIVMTKLDRAWRSLTEMQLQLDKWVNAGLEVRILDFMGGAPIARDNPMSRMMLQMLASFAEYERGLISQRTKEGLGHIKRQIDTLGAYKTKKTGRTIERLGPSDANIVAAVKAAAMACNDAQLARAQEIAPHFQAAVETVKKKRPEALYVHGKLNVDLVCHWMRQNTKIVVPMVKRTQQANAFYKDGRYVQSIRDVSNITLRRILAAAIEYGFIDREILMEGKT